MEKVLAEYIENATQNSPHISTRIFFLISLRIILTRILVKLSVSLLRITTWSPHPPTAWQRLTPVFRQVMENAEPCYIHVRTAKTEWIIDIKNQTYVEAAPLPRTQVNEY